MGLRIRLALRNCANPQIRHRAPPGRFPSSTSVMSVEPQSPNKLGRHESRNTLLVSLSSALFSCSCFSDSLARARARVFASLAIMRSPSRSCKGRSLSVNPKSVLEMLHDRENLRRRVSILAIYYLSLKDPVAFPFDRVRPGHR